MRERYRMYQRNGGSFYAKDRKTGQSFSLATSDKREAARLLVAKNQSTEQPCLNVAMAKVYLSAQSPEFVTRTWGELIDLVARGYEGATAIRWKKFAISAPLKLMVKLPLHQTESVHFLAVLNHKRAGVSTNVWLRILGIAGQSHLVLPDVAKNRNFLGGEVIPRVITSDFEKLPLVMLHDDLLLTIERFPEKSGPVRRWTKLFRREVRVMGKAVIRPRSARGCDGKTTDGSRQTWTGSFTKRTTVPVFREGRPPVQGQKLPFASFLRTILYRKIIRSSGLIGLSANLLTVSMKNLFLWKYFLEQSDHPSTRPVCYSCQPSSKEIRINLHIIIENGQTKHILALWKSRNILANWEIELDPYAAYERCLKRKWRGEPPYPCARIRHLKAGEASS